MELLYINNVIWVEIGDMFCSFVGWVEGWEVSYMGERGCFITVRLPETQHLSNKSLHQGIPRPYFVISSPIFG